VERRRGRTRKGRGGGKAEGRKGRNKRGKEGRKRETIN